MMFRQLVSSSLRLSVRGPARLALRSQARMFTPFQHRSFSSGMDDDFKPQVKVSEEDEIVKIIKEDVKSPVFVYMKGTPDAPQCGFSMQVVRILQYLGVSFQSRNVLEAAALRETVKTFSDWPTIPQVYVEGEFIGGCDIVTSMFKSGELQEVLEGAKSVKMTGPPQE